MAIRRDHDSIEVNALLAEIEVKVTTSPTRSESDVCLLQPVAYKTSLKDIGAWLQTLEAKRPRSICAGTDSRPLDEDLDCWESLVCRSVDDGAHDAPELVSLLCIDLAQTKGKANQKQEQEPTKSLSCHCVKVLSE